MNTKSRTYIAIDLKSFYASVECVERGLNPLTTHLVVADAGRTEKTICLAVTPTLKAYGIPGRARLFEVVGKISDINRERRANAPNHLFSGKSYHSEQLKANPGWEVSYIVAPPRMGLYIEYSKRIYSVYLKYVAPEDIHVYSIDEVFIDATDYLKSNRLTPHEMTVMIIQEIIKTTGITATAGIGTNLYLAKIAMDIQAKHTEPDKNGVRMAFLDELSYRRQLWSHRPLTDFWRVGRGYAAKLQANGLFTMGDIARCSIGKASDKKNEELLYRLFGINAELLIDHAWGYESCTIKDIKAYRPRTGSISSGQVLSAPYSFEKAKLIVCEMTDLLALDLVEREMTTNQLVLNVGYDVENLQSAQHRDAYHGDIVIDHYGRKVPKPAHGSINIEQHTASTKIIMKAIINLYDRIVDKELTIRRINIAACHLINERNSIKVDSCQQLDMFENYDRVKQQEKEEKQSLTKEKKVQKAIIKLKQRYGKNAVLKGMNFGEGATTIARNKQIGGHQA